MVLQKAAQRQSNEQERLYGRYKRKLYVHIYCFGMFSRCCIRHIQNGPSVETQSAECSLCAGNQRKKDCAIRWMSKCLCVNRWFISLCANALKNHCAEGSLLNCCAEKILRPHISSLRKLLWNKDWKIYRMPLVLAVKKWYRGMITLLCFWKSAWCFGILYGASETISGTVSGLPSHHKEQKSPFVFFLLMFPCFENDIEIIFWKCFYLLQRQNLCCAGESAEYSCADTKIFASPRIFCA